MNISAAHFRAQAVQSAAAVPLRCPACGAVRAGAHRPEPRHAAPRSRKQRQAAVHSVAVDDVPAQASASPSVKDRKYVMVSGKGGVGKTSVSASLAVKYAMEGHDTLIVSTDPAHSLGDSLGQPLPGGTPVPIEGTDLPIWGMEIDPDKATANFKAFAASGGKDKLKVCALHLLMQPCGHSAMTCLAPHARRRVHGHDVCMRTWHTAR